MTKAVERLDPADFESNEAPEPGVGSPGISITGRMNHLDWTRIAFGVVLAVTFLVTIIICGIGWLKGDTVSDFLPVVGASSTVLGTAIGYFFGVERGRAQQRG